MDNVDPFFAVKDEVESSLNNVKSLYDKWLQQMKSPQSSISKLDLNRIEIKITELIENIDMDIIDLDQTIQIVETNPKKFNINQEEIQKRKQFISYTKNTIRNIQTVIQNPNNNIKNKSMLRTSSSDPLTTPLNHNDVKIDNEYRHQQLLLQDQNETLDQVLGTVYTMKEVAINMNQELDDQQGLLNELDEDVDNTTSNLGNARRRLDMVLESDDCNSCSILCTIILLTVIFITLLVM